VLVLSKGLVPPLGTLPSAFVAERTASWAVGVLGGPAHAASALDAGASLMLAAADPAFRSQVADALTAAGFDAAVTADVIGVELAGCAKDAAALAAAAAAHAGPTAAGSAAGKVFGEVEAYARSAGAQPGTFAGLAGAGDLVATMMSPESRRAGELLAQGAARDGIAEIARSVPLLADRVKAAGIPAPTLRGLADVIDGKVAPERWAESLTAPRPREQVKVA
jgi:glycerol-3-phosphate dehydrogenase (NAD(P)+)